MIRKVDVAPKFLKLHASRPVAKYLELESLLAGGFLPRLRAIAAERRLARHTEGEWEASGQEYENLCDELNYLQNASILGKPFGKEAMQNIQKIIDAGISEAYIRNWVVNGHIGADGLITETRSEPKTILTSILGWVWHALTGLTTVLFLAYAWALPGPFPNKLLATLLILCVFGILSILMNSQSLSALPPSSRVWSQLKKVLHD